MKVRHNNKREAEVTLTELEWSYLKSLLRRALTRRQHKSLFISGDRELVTKLLEAPEWLQISNGTWYPYNQNCPSCGQHVEPQKD